MSIYIYIYTHTHVRMYMHAYENIYIYKIYRYICMCIYKYIYVYIYTYLWGGLFEIQCGFRFLCQFGLHRFLSLSLSPSSLLFRVCVSVVPWRLQRLLARALSSCRVATLYKPLSQNGYGLYIYIYYVCYIYYTGGAGITQLRVFLSLLVKRSSSVPIFFGVRLSR